MESGSASPARTSGAARFLHVSEDKEPNWLVELAKNAEVLRRQIDEGGQAMRQQIEQLLRAAEQFVLDAQRAKVGAEMVRAVAAAIRELVPVAGYPVRYGSFRGHITSVAAVAGVASAAGVAPSPTILITDGDAARGTEAASVQVVPVQEPGLIERNLGRIFALVLVGIVAWRLLVVPERDRAVVDHWLTVLSFALTVAALIWTWNKQK